MKNKEWYKSYSNVLCLIGILIIICIFYFLMNKDTLNSSDSILLTLISVIITSLISFYLGRHFSYDEGVKRLEGEATKALRRIIRIQQSAVRLKANCNRISDEIIYNLNVDSEQLLLLEYVQGISNGLDDLLGNIESSIDDWGDMLPDKVNELKKADSVQLINVDEVQKELRSLRDEYKGKIEESEGDTKKELREEWKQKHQELLSELKKDIAQIRAEASPHISPVDLLDSFPSSGTARASLSLSGYGSIPPSFTPGVSHIEIKSDPKEYISSAVEKKPKKNNKSEKKE